MSDRLELELGIDVGSVSAKVVVVDVEGIILEDIYRRIHGRPLETTLALLDELVAKYGRDRFAHVSFTGSGGKLLAQALDALCVNEIVAQARAEAEFYPEVRTIIEIGGEDSKLILLKKESGKTVIDDFAMNSVCAAGTGSFLDQQAARLKVSIEEEFGRLAMKSERPPRIAGRCTVFAKSDMIHLQQKATPDYDIIAGLCFALARNFKGNVGRGREFTKPIAFQGGVAANAGVVRAFTEILALAPGELVIPEHFTSMGAIGAVLDRRDQNIASPFRGTDALRAFLREKPAARRRQAPLPKPDGARIAAQPIGPMGAIGRMDVWLGIDVGSISTKVVAIDAQKRVLAKAYLMTAGRPIEAVRDGLRIVGAQVARHANVLGVGTTGSGRYLIGDFVGADVVRNEITAQAIASIHIDPEVDTIFEIGGQDSKYISIDNGVVVDFQMNHVCAAGTGSFLEEQAEKLGINIRSEFAREALGCPSPVRLGERCTVFMESDIVLHQQTGASRDELVAGLCYSIVQNYLNRVVGTRRIGKRIFFQGGTAFNDGVLAAFRAVTGKHVVVPPDHEVTGAIGAAILAMAAPPSPPSSGERVGVRWSSGAPNSAPHPGPLPRGRGRGEEEGGPATRFKGFDLSERKYELKRFPCGDCPNACEINEVILEGEAPLYYGSRCDKYNLRKKADALSPERDLFRRREELLTACLAASSVGGDLRVPPLRKQKERQKQGGHMGPPLQEKPKRGKAGIPRALALSEMLPFWVAFARELGYEPVVSPPTHRGIIAKGVEAVATETCFPVKVAHGHVLDLLDRGVDILLLPSIISSDSEFARQETSVLCPYVQSIAYVVKAAILFPENVRLVTFPVRLEGGRSALAKDILESCGDLGWTKSEVERALAKAETAQAEFRAACREEGRKLLASLEENKEKLRPVVIIARPYNGCDRGVNLDLPRKLADLGMLPVPIDFLPLEADDLGGAWDNLYWQYGQKIMAAANFVARHPLFAAVYLTNFSCGPDSFLTTFFRKAMGRKPALLIEIDEHSADAGVITRLEAFLDSLVGAAERRTSTGESAPKLASRTNGRRIWIPNMCDHAFPFAAAVRGAGLDSEVLPPSDETSLELGRRYTTGKECLPAIVTAGDMLRLVLSPGFDRDANAFFMPTGSGPCRFGEYSRLHRYILKEVGFEDVPILSPNQGARFYDGFRRMEKDFSRGAWQGMIVVDLLQKMLHRIRPYETSPGETDRVYREAVEAVSRAIESGADLERAVRRSVAELSAVKTTGERRPVVGVVGEIYVRSHAFSNANVVRRLESMGAEVSLAGFREWIYYTNFTRACRSRRERDFVTTFKDAIKHWVQRKDERWLGAPFVDALDETLEPPTEELLALAAPYIHESFEGEAVLSVGKSVEYFREHASGVVNVMPFACMPGSIVTAVLKRVREDCDQMPVVSLSYDGQSEGGTVTRLEAFMHQVREFHRRQLRRTHRRNGVTVG